MATRNRLKEKLRKQKRNRRIIGGSIAIGILAVISLIVWRENRPGIGEEIPVARADHVDFGEAVESPTDPPTSGSHYAAPMPEGFYTVESPEYLAEDHDGFLIHSLEHGYVVFWYNCQPLDEQSCSELTTNIQAVMDDFDGHKLIAFPRLSITAPLVMTSWGQLQEFDVFDEELAKEFITVNKSRAPEPDAP
jgi:hypothetical protein